MQNNPKPDSAPKDLLDWLGLTDTPNWTRARALGAVVSVLLTLLFVLALVAAFTLLGRTLLPSAEAAGGNIGTGALIVALLGAPFLIWNTVIKHRALGFQKEGHLTDRISKAVEQLGAEKTVDRIGRAVTVLSGAVTNHIRTSPPESTPDLGPNEKCYEMLGEDVDQEGLHWQHAVKRWSDRRTLIEWRGEVLRLEPNEVVVERDKWQAFAETLPNIEVRIGGILSLERIAQDSIAYDKGRDHVRVMEILCAYIRENAPAVNLDPTPLPFTTKMPRIDIQTALNVIKRRAPSQVALEQVARYRLDLRSTDLDGCDFRSGKFAGAIFWRSRFEASNFDNCDISGARMQYCLLNFATFWEANLQGAILDHCVNNQPENSMALDFTIGNIKGVSVVGADLTAIGYLGEKATNLFGSKDTKLSNGAQEELDSLIELEIALKNARKSKDAVLVMSLEAKIDVHPFSKWFKYSSSDMAMGKFREDFHNRHGLSAWPLKD